MNSLLLIAAHMLGDYVLQTDAMAASKLTDWRVRAWHVSAYCLGFVPFLFLAGVPFGAGRQAVFLAALWVTHFVTDSRRWASGDKWPPKPVLVDQTIHLVTLAVLGRVMGL